MGAKRKNDVDGNGVHSMDRRKNERGRWIKRRSTEEGKALRAEEEGAASPPSGKTLERSETEIEAEMSEREEDIDSDAPEEFTSEQGLQNDEELRKVQEENKAREANLDTQFCFSLLLSLAGAVENGVFSFGGVVICFLCNSIAETLAYLEYLSLSISSIHLNALHANLLSKEVECKSMADNIIPYEDNISNGPLCRIAREGKDRRRQWAQKKTPRKSPRAENIRDVIEPESTKESPDNAGMLPNDIVKLLAAREKKVFESDSEGEKEETTNKKRTSKKKRSKSSGLEPIILKDLPPPQCLQNSLEFLKKRKMQVARSSSVLNNSNQALRLLSKSGLLSMK
ncbi:hypothetical protein RHSIM_Rhsim08G0109100 [Rhododendron simsii]|uniref:Uncharacterized protein n=1 Tax=Rhododendron simsii TaxID=118357 RepID=A0A834GJ72_RHOSS|nr:hypothetical protein RHSIM_Rhsim08G0109100 [Rhododendron simsii]